MSTTKPEAPTEAPKPDEPAALPVDGIETGTFRVLKSSCIAGVAVTEYETE